MSFQSKTTQAYISFQQNCSQEAAVPRVITKRKKFGWTLGICQKATIRRDFLKGGDLVQLFHMDQQCNLFARINDLQYRYSDKFCEHFFKDMKQSQAGF